MDVERQTMEVDIACVGFGPAMGGFLTTLSRAMAEGGGEPAFTSRVMPGMPLQALCYERADDLGFGVSGVVTRARGIRESFPDLDPGQIPMAHGVTREKVAYLKDPIGVSRRSAGLVALDGLTGVVKSREYAVELPYPDRRDSASSQGLSTCCHGEEPHVVGWRFIKERRAVNLDPNCG